MPTEEHSITKSEILTLSPSQLGDSDLVTIDDVSYFVRTFKQQNTKLYAVINGIMREVKEFEQRVVAVRKYKGRLCAVIVSDEDTKGNIFIVELDSNFNPTNLIFEAYYNTRFTAGGFWFYGDFLYFYAGHYTGTRDLGLDGNMYYYDVRLHQYDIAEDRLTVGDHISSVTQYSQASYMNITNFLPPLYYDGYFYEERSGNLFRFPVGNLGMVEQCFISSNDDVKDDVCAILGTDSVLVRRKILIAEQEYNYVYTATRFHANSGNSPRAYHEEVTILDTKAYALRHNTEICKYTVNGFLWLDSDYFYFEIDSYNEADKDSLTHLLRVSRENPKETKICFTHDYIVQIESNREKMLLEIWYKNSYESEADIYDYYFLEDEEFVPIGQLKFEDIRIDDE